MFHEGTRDVVYRDVAPRNNLRELSEAVGDEEDEVYAAQDLWEGPKNVDCDSLERPLGRDAREKIYLIDKANPVLRILGTFTHRANDVCCHWGQ